MTFEIGDKVYFQIKDSAGDTMLSYPGRWRGVITRLPLGNYASPLSLIGADLATFSYEVEILSMVHAENPYGHKVGLKATISQHHLEHVPALEQLAEAAE